MGEQEKVNTSRARKRLTVHTVSHRLCSVKNITLSVDEDVLAAARRYAFERNSTVNGLVREFLSEVASREDRARKARRRIRQLSNRSSARAGVRSWSRDELHGR